jgi:hypothetical protein
MSRTNKKMKAIVLRDRLERVEKAIKVENVLAKATREALAAAEIEDDIIADDPWGRDEDEIEDDWSFTDRDGKTTGPKQWKTAPMLATAILTETREVKIATEKQWSAFFAKAKKRLVNVDHVDGVSVSTVFFGVNRGRPPDKPLWFETLVSGGDLDGHIEMYSTWDEAMIGHNAIVEVLRAEAAKRRPVTKSVERVRRENRV